jgi:hypothetical protein
MISVKLLIDPSQPISTFPITYHTMHIVSAVSWNGSTFYWNVDRNRWDPADNIIPSQAHEATQADLRIARQHAEDEGQLAIADGAMLVDYDEHADA